VLIESNSKYLQRQTNDNTVGSNDIAIACQQRYDKDVCPHCRDFLIVFDPETEETICSNCGMIIEESIETLQSHYKDCSNQDIKESWGSRIRYNSLAFHDMGLSTRIPYSKKDARGAFISQNQMNESQKIRKWDKISKRNNGERCSMQKLKKAFAIMSTIRDKISLSDTIIEEAAYYYRKAIHKDIITGRSVESMSAACIYIACKELNIPRTLAEIAASIDIDLTFVGKCFRLLLTHLTIKNIHNTDHNSYLSKIASKAKVTQKTYRRALHMLSEIKENPVFFGKNPNALAVAVLYAACMNEREKIRPLDIALAGDTSMVTLRKRLADVQNVLVLSQT
jgi:transcription initiation factor TFIIB